MIIRDKFPSILNKKQLKTKKSVNKSLIMPTIKYDNIKKEEKQIEKKLVPKKFTRYYSANAHRSEIITEKKRIENYDRFNKEINQANNTLETMLATCNKLLENTNNKEETNNEDKIIQKTEKIPEEEYLDDFENNEDLFQLKMVLFLYF